MSRLIYVVVIVLLVIGLYFYIPKVKNRNIPREVEVSLCQDILVPRQIFCNLRKNTVNLVNKYKSAEKLNLDFGWLKF